MTDSLQCERVLYSVSLLKTIFIVNKITIKFSMQASKAKLRVY